MPAHRVAIGFVGILLFALAPLEAGDRPGSTLPGRYQTLAKAERLKLLDVWGSPETDLQTSLAFLSQDGRLALVGSIGTDFAEPANTPSAPLQVIDARSGKVLRELATGAGRIAWFDLTPDGKRALALLRVSKDNKDLHHLTHWDTATGKAMPALALEGNPTRVSLFPSGKRALVAHGDNQLTIWDLEAGKKVRDWKGVSTVMTLAVSADGQRAVTGSETGAVHVWDLEKGKEIRKWGDQNNFIVAVAFDSQGRRVFAAAYGQSIKVYDVETGKVVSTLKRDQADNRFFSLAPSPDGKSVLVGSAGTDPTSGAWAGGTVALHDADTGNELWRAQQRIVWPLAIQWQPDGTILTGGGSNPFARWEAKSGKLQHTWGGHRAQVNALAAGPNGLVVSAGADGLVKIWNADGTEKTTITAHEQPITSVALAPGGKRVLMLTASTDKTVKLWDLGSAKVLKTLTGHPGNVTSVVVTPDGQWACSSSERTIKVWDLAEGKEVQSVNAHSESVNALAVSPNGKLLASASDDNSIKLWQIKEGKLTTPRTLNAHTRQVTCLAFSGDGMRLLSGGQDKEIVVWDVASGKPAQTLKGHGNWIHALAFHGETVALSASDDLTVKMWNLNTGKELATIDLGKCGDSARCFTQSRSGEVLVGASSWVVLRFAISRE